MEYIRISGMNDIDCSKNPGQFRDFLRRTVYPYLNTIVKKRDASRETGISEGALDLMLYRGKGGLDAWIKLICFVYGMDSQQLISKLVEIRCMIRKKNKSTPGQIKFLKIMDLLTEDKIVFYSSVIEAVENIKRSLYLKKEKKK